MQKIMENIRNFKRYSYLLMLLTGKNIRKKYKGSILGIIWSLLSPLLDMVVLTIVFSTLLSRKIENFPVYLLSGRLLYGFFSSSTTSSMKSILGSASLIKKVYIPKYIMTLSKLLSGFVFFLISLIDLILIMVVTHAKVSMNLLYAPVYILLLFVFVCGVSFILSTVTVFFRDMEHLYSVFTTVLMYLSAIFYPIDIVPVKYRFILYANPLFHYISGFRQVVYYGMPPDINNLAICTILAMITLIVGTIVFVKNQDKFILNL